MHQRVSSLLSSLSFRAKVIAASFICIALPAVLTLFIYSYLTRDAVEEQAFMNLSRELELVNGNVVKLLEDMLYVLNFVQIDSELNSIFKNIVYNESYDELKDDYERFTDHSKVMKTIDNITLLGEKFYVTILLTEGSFYTNYPVSDYNPVEMFYEEWFQAIDNVEGYESVWIGTHPTIYQSEIENNPYQISAARTLRNQNSDIYGYVIVSIMENKVNQLFDSSVGKEEVLLVDSSGRILSHRDQDRIGTEFSYGKNSFGRREIVHGAETDYLLAEQTISFTGWRLLSFIPYKDAVHNIHAIFNKAFFIQIFSFIVFFLLLAYLLNTLTKPLMKFSHVAAAVQRGSLEVRSQIRSKDEIGRLSTSFDNMLDRVNEMIEEIKASELKKRRAEFAMLQAQINPHFLFNILNSIRMKVLKKGDRENAEIISTLSKLLRMTINKDRGTIAIHEEIEIVIDYVRLMNMRLREKVLFQADVAPDVYLEKIPRLILQPIIENAIIHGFHQGPGTIRLHAYKSGNENIIHIEDDGQGMADETLQSLKQAIVSSTSVRENDMKNSGFSSIGLTNVYERLVLTYGEAFRMDVDSKEGEGTKVSMYIPAEAGDVDV
ncbi:two-component system, sensor histidine kinase YesM [Evansella caseinilytica]|uniref:Two-component system, sensor histidine kinase YesM n=1 Tax=Evansella caseinilytica TaxID=1503961 RepID=A0A1H3U0K8_9BACI|nr:sensor histidine kinase [Evansella caseinilytica]SDZ56046.1 two-component system, sensor histidine kinase YesM [Evansella caseinilytica]